MNTLHRRLTGLLLAVFILVSGAAAVNSQNTCGGSGQSEQIVGSVVRFTSGSTSVDVTIGEDNPTVRDFLSRLPLTLNLEEFAGREKIGYFERKLTTDGSPGSDPEDGDLIYFVPWCNLGFYYDAAGIGFSDQTIHIGKYKASAAELERLTSQPVRIEPVP